MICYKCTGKEKLCNFEKGILKQVLPLNVFIERCEKIHKKRYDLSRISYRNLHDKIEVGCKIEGHGFFETEANNFMRGFSNCKLCSAKETSIRCRKTTEEFIKAAKDKHKETYDYSVVNYMGSKKDVLIKCKKPNHGIFPQLPSVHLSGSGCPKCANELRAKKLSLTMDQFLKRARKKHGDVYDYSKVNYETAIKEVLIGCPKHGFFPTTPNRFLDKRIIDFSALICPELGISHRNTKYLLKNILKSYIPENYYLQHKQGFSFDLNSLLRNELKEDFTDTLMSQNLFGNELIDSKVIYEMVNNFYEGKGITNEWGLWTLFSLQKWSKLVYNN